MSGQGGADGEDSGLTEFCLVIAEVHTCYLPSCLCYTQDQIYMWTYMYLFIFKIHQSSPANNFM